MNRMMNRAKHANAVTMLRDIKNGYSGLTPETQESIKPYYETLMNLPEDQQGEVLDVCATLQNKVVGLSPLGALELAGKVGKHLHGAKTK